MKFYDQDQDTTNTKTHPLTPWYDIDLDRTVTIAELVNLAAWLTSEESENVEYDRALSELVTDAAGLPSDCKDDVLTLIRRSR